MSMDMAASDPMSADTEQEQQQRAGQGQAAAAVAAAAEMDTDSGLDRRLRTAAEAAGAQGPKRLFGWASGGARGVKP